MQNYRRCMDMDCNYTIYTTHSCGKCQMVKAAFKRKNIPYNEVFVDDHPEIAQSFGIQSTPVLMDKQGVRYEDMNAVKFANTL